MCGIFAILNNKSSFDNSYIENAFNLLNARGPESSKFNTYSDKLILGFKRLAINGLTEASDQPITINGITLICNGEIYNYKCLFKELYESHNIVAKTESDCEVIIYLYKIYGIEQTLRLLDGVFSFILYDNSDITTDTKIYIARDPFGVRPLFILRKQQNVNNDKNIFNNLNVIKENIIGFSSEMKALYPIYSKDGQSLMYTSKLNIFNNTRSKENSIYKSFEIIPFEPGSYSKYTFAFKVNGKKIELCRTSHEKSVSDLIKCTNIPENTRICFLDDQFHSLMEHDNVYYINLKGYEHSLSFEEMALRYYNNINNNVNKDEFIDFIVKHMKNSNYNVVNKSVEEQNIDNIISKKALSHLKDFFKDTKKSNKTKKHKSKPNNKTRRI